MSLKGLIARLNYSFKLDWICFEYTDIRRLSLSWGIIPNSRNRLSFRKRWPGVLQYTLGNDFHVIEECLNGRTTMFDDANRSQRNGLESIQMILESHSPVELMILMLGINDFQDVIGANAKESALGLKHLIAKIQSLSPEPMRRPCQILVVIAPEIHQPLGQMADKFSGYLRGKASEVECIKQISELNVHILSASHYVSLSQIDGIHLDEREHAVLGKAIAKKVRQLNY